MRYLLFILLLNISCIVGAAVPASPACGEIESSQVSFSTERSAEKRGFLKRFAEKRLLKRMSKIMARSGEGDGKWLAIAGLTLAVLGVLSLSFIFIIDFYLPFALGIAGLFCSIFGLIKASSWQDTRGIRRLAIVGIVLSALLVVVSAVALRLIAY
ncbi:MAG: hypothetical protein EPGJADBJ_02580 [Saprospiraceae bacterium]|nr:hypothetical protein [Saprospiraceae bacterium]